MGGRGVDVKCGFCFFSVTEKPQSDFKSRRALGALCGPQWKTEATQSGAAALDEEKERMATPVAAGCLLGASDHRFSAPYKGPLLPAHNLLVLILQAHLKYHLL